jgi:hypothetical protein
VASSPKRLLRHLGLEVESRCGSFFTLLNFGKNISAVFLGIPRQVGDFFKEINSES